jgi:hypothetical protein
MNSCEENGGRRGRRSEEYDERGVGEGNLMRFGRLQPNIWEVN